MNNDIIQVISGIRRCGKSYLFFDKFNKQYTENQY